MIARFLRVADKVLLPCFERGGRRTRDLVAETGGTARSTSEGKSASAVTARGGPWQGIQMMGLPIEPPPLVRCFGNPRPTRQASPPPPLPIFRAVSSGRGHKIPCPGSR